VSGLYYDHHKSHGVAGGGAGAVVSAPREFAASEGVRIRAYVLGVLCAGGAAVGVMERATAHHRSDSAV